EIPKAYVVRKAGSKVTEQDVLHYVSTKVAPFKKVRAVEFIDVIPKSLSGKILRRELQVKENESLKLLGTIQRATLLVGSPTSSPP
ncbi:hypothetical protein PybrP1_009113, partial [[Pythium] brassicae (nom. inval.)]